MGRDYLQVSPMNSSSEHYDYIVIGSGFGGSVSGLRLVEKGYRVLMLEKGRRFEATDFPKSNWDLKRWLWFPALNCRGIFQMNFFRHLTVFSGVGVGGGSLVYGCTLPIPNREFFESDSWRKLEDWESSLASHYQTSLRMLGASDSPAASPADKALRDLANEMGEGSKWSPTRVSIYMGKPGVSVEDPYFGGEGPPRTGCIQCGGCMIGCQHGAKNSLDCNYLYLAEKRGLVIEPETEVRAVRSRPSGGYRVEAYKDQGWLRQKVARTYSADNVVFSGGVLGTVDLLLKMREDPKGLPELSPRVGDFIRTNSESLTAIISPSSSHDFSKGVAIGSIFHTDEHSHIEPVRYSEGSGFFRTLMAPHAPGKTAAKRFLGAGRRLLKEPIRWAKALSVPDLSRATTILLYMRSLEGTMSFRRGRFVTTFLKKGLVSELNSKAAPSASIPEATELAEKMAEKLNGVVGSLVTETLFGTPSTAHILGGACMGKSYKEGVIDKDHRVFGYDGLYVIDGSAISANPGVNPSLTITAMAERAMSKIGPKLS